MVSSSHATKIVITRAAIRMMDVFGFCDLDLDLMTFMYEPNPYWLEINWMCEYKFLRQGFRKLLSDRHKDRQTELTEIIKHTASRVLKYVNYPYKQ